MHNLYSEQSAEQWINQLFMRAIPLSVSDIHLEPEQHGYRVRFRRDGILQVIDHVSSDLATQINSRLKVLSHLDITEKRLPQDGQLVLTEYPSINIRISTCPTVFGEKIALRLLPTYHQTFAIQTLGMTPVQQRLFQQFLSRPQGFILVTGPTGSGKTMTLYAALQYLNHAKKNIVTLEDPVEIKLPGINQIHIHPRIGLTFASLLRSLLRQDPDVIMIGEIRDNETARIAMMASETGHLVLSTLHTHRAHTALLRLKHLGVTPHDLQTLKPLIISQRLLRKRCTYFQTHHTKHTHCPHCYCGYQGRIGIFELLTFTPTETCHCTLQEAGLLKIKSGLTTKKELTRVLE